MEFKLHTNFPNDLKAQWDMLLDQSINDVPFLRYEYLENWWHTRGGGEWTDKNQLAIISAHEGKTLVGIAPFFINKEEDKNTLYLLGSKEICDYLDLIVKPTDLDLFVRELTGFINNKSFPSWDQIVLDNLLQTSPLVVALEKTAIERGWKFKSECIKQSPYIKLPGNWEEYLNSIDNKQRHEIRRKMRRAEENTDLKWYFVEEESSLDTEIESFLQLMALDKEKSIFLTTQMREQMRLTIQWAFKTNILQLSFLEIQTQKAAGYLCFHYKNRLLVYNSGFDPGFSEYSPGWVLLANLLRWSNENQIVEFDFMRGNEDYKYRFGAQDRFLVCVIIDR